jgi:hypothetical protein
MLVMAKNDEAENNGSIQEPTVAASRDRSSFLFSLSENSERRYYPILIMMQRISLLSIGRDEVPS